MKIGRKFINLLSNILIICCKLSSQTQAETTATPEVPDVPNSFYTKAFQQSTRLISQLKHDNGAGVLTADGLVTSLSASGMSTAAFVTMLTHTEEAVSDRCAAELRQLLLGLRDGERWALEFADSTGKLPAGLLSGAASWLGSFDQCLDAKSPSAEASTTARDSQNASSLNSTGSYCLLEFEANFINTGRNAGIKPQAILTPESQKHGGHVVLKLGTCWPSGCSMQDAINATSHLLWRLQQTMGSRLDVRVRGYGSAGECKRLDNRPVLKTGSIVMICLLSLLAFCLLAGTAVDFIDRCRLMHLAVAVAAAGRSHDSHIEDDNTNGSLESSVSGDGEALIAAAAINRDNQSQGWLRGTKSFLLCFSIPANASKLLSNNQPDHNMQCTNGIRFLSMSWVILGHTYLNLLPGMSNPLYLTPKWLNNWTFQAVLNANFAVDTFFLLSGMLATYLFLREYHIRGRMLRRINWLRFYLHRYLRLTAPYMIILGAYATLPQYLFDGPMYPSEGFDKACDTTWWHNLLYINNLFDMKDMCMPWSWYLANDMQFYALSPLILIPLALKPALGLAIVTAAILASTTAQGVHSTLNHQPAGSMINEEYYIRPWFRVVPYLVGSLVGLAAHRLLAPRRAASNNNFTNSTIRQRRQSLHRRWILSVPFWIIAAGLCAAPVYGLFDVQRGRVTPPQHLASLYNCTCRLAWALGVAMVILACVTGNGGAVTNFLSSGIFAPLSRLSYCAYLLHPAIMMAVETARRDAIQLNAWTPIGTYLSYLLAAYLAAFVGFLSLESPLTNLEQLLKNL